ncbi:MAG TPA: hypothetical protein VEU30_06655, partial [Thermoanaerobaculia bacterium]|nr:hypothetical protein [Thermoanaerobaculia bacterium]
MPLLLGPSASAVKCELQSQQTFGEFLKANDLEGKLDDVALCNWGTKVAAEVNRMLVERLGCYEADADPLKSKLDPAFALVKTIVKPAAWKPESGLELDKTHTIKVKKKLPVPAVSISKLTRFFKPGDQCEVEYLLEGVADRASTVDVEVHVARYWMIEDG